jgi:hypothetical protein
MRRNTSPKNFMIVSWISKSLNQGGSHHFYIEDVHFLCMAHDGCNLQTSVHITWGVKGLLVGAPDFQSSQGWRH